MLLRAIVATSVRVAAASSPTAQEFSTKNGLRKNKKKKKVERRIWKVLYVSKRDFFL